MNGADCRTDPNRGKVTARSRLKKSFIFGVDGVEFDLLYNKTNGMKP